MKQAIDQEGKSDTKVKVASLLYGVEDKSVKCSIPGISKDNDFSTLQIYLKCGKRILLVKENFYHEKILDVHLKMLN